MQLSVAIVAIAFLAVAMAEFTCPPKAETNSTSVDFGGCCQKIGYHNEGQNCTRAPVTSNATVTNLNGTSTSVQRYLCSKTDKPESFCCHSRDLDKIHDADPMVCDDEISPA